LLTAPSGSPLKVVSQALGVRAALFPRRGGDPRPLPLAF
jgi:hypothetical protein